MQTRRIRSAIPIYIAALVWVLYGLALPIYQIAHIILATCLSVVAFLVACRFFPGRTVEVPVELKSGDSRLDEELKKSRDELTTLRSVNRDIASPVMTDKLDRLDKAGQAILNAVAEKPERATVVRKFMKYYLPTTAKLLEQYRVLSGVSTKGEHIGRAMQSVENSLDLIVKAFEKQLDLLYQGEAMDIASDVTVLETMMKGDGLTDEGIQKAVKEDTQPCLKTSN